LPDAPVAICSQIAYTYGIAQLQFIVDVSNSFQAADSCIELMAVLASPIVRSKPLIVLLNKSYGATAC
jgi:hypothetical protein